MKDDNVRPPGFMDKDRNKESKTSHTARTKLSKTWTPFQELAIEEVAFRPLTCVAAWRNSRFNVQAHIRQTDIGPVELLGIRANDPALNGRTTWAQKQRIKNELYGPARAALEVYPPDSDRVGEEADIFWLWIMPEEEGLPFNLYGEGRPAGQKIVHIDGQNLSVDPDRTVIQMPKIITGGQRGGRRSAVLTSEEIIINK